MGIIRATGTAGTTEMPATPANPLSLAAARLADAASSWSIGTYGVLAEFARDPGEPCERDELRVVTARGAIRVERNPAITALAYEVLSVQPALWHHGVLFNLPAAEAAMPVRHAVTELGPDREAICAADRAAPLFDLGLGSPAFAFCVRTDDPGLVAALRRAAGKRLLQAGQELTAALVEASPHRVAVSRVARIEVYQRIAPEDGATPSGPHTHLIPRLLRPARLHSTNVSLSSGLVPGLALYPPHPAKDEAGVPKPFAREEHAAFQALLARFGDPEAQAAKAAIVDAVARGDSPGTWRAPATRNARAACRIALRQLRQSGAGSPLLEAWQRALDRAQRCA